MSNYIPGVGAFKKRKIRDKRVEELMGAIKRQESPERIERAAEKVRDAQLSVLRCLE
ncbi:hypothetical protein [Haloferula sp. BvORR071]|uniref:hypothetical protein n=1 Tax=Haloferula sp. BvORR071 TaxID=1396141 RepID=UPI002240FEEA|nr:hypothetical protein [Haloferula sp. BvORR071]